MDKIYAGIGSRDSPPRIIELMTDIGEYLAKKGYILRSGGADGADTAFEKGCDAARGKKEIYLPWRSFNNNLSPLCSVTPAAMDLAELYHPAYEKLSHSSKLLMARNGFQVLGRDLQTPVRFIVCYTLDAQVIGGTGQALRIAMDRKIPILNLGDRKDETLILQWLTLKLDFLEDIYYDLFGDGHEQV